MQCSQGAEGHAIQPGTDNGTWRGLTGNTCHRLLDEKPGQNALAKLEPTIQEWFRFACTVRPMNDDRPCTACSSAYDQELAASCTDRVVRLVDGRIAAGRI
jgi:hypothetical protein